MHARAGGGGAGLTIDTTKLSHPEAELVYKQATPTNSSTAAAAACWPQPSPTMAQPSPKAQEEQQQAAVCAQAASSTPSHAPTKPAPSARVTAELARAVHYGSAAFSGFHEAALLQQLKQALVAMSDDAALAASSSLSPKSDRVMEVVGMVVVGEGDAVGCRCWPPTSHPPSTARPQPLRTPRGHQWIV